MSRGWGVRGRTEHLVGRTAGPTLLLKNTLTFRDPFWNTSSHLAATGGTLSGRGEPLRLTTRTLGISEPPLFLYASTLTGLQLARAALDQRPGLGEEPLSPQRSQTASGEPSLSLKRSYDSSTMKKVNAAFFMKQKKKSFSEENLTIRHCAQNT